MINLINDKFSFLNKNNNLTFLKNNKKNPYNKVIFTIFTGRKCYLDVLFIYLDTLLKNNIINEIHLWNYTRNKDDEKYVIDWCNKNKKYILFQPKKNLNQWDEYYKYYSSNNFNDNDILIKCDDDVVYIDINKMKSFLDQVNDDYLYYPNIINNDVCAYVQSKYGIHNLLNKISNKNNTQGNYEPLTDWYLSFNKANKIHNHFLKNKSKYIIKNTNNIKWNSRISINFYAGRFSTIKKLYNDFINRTTLIDKKSADEAYLSGYICKKFNTYNIIVPFFNIVHFSFAFQNPIKLDNLYLPYYYELALNNKINKKFRAAWCKKNNKLWIKSWNNNSLFLKNKNIKMIYKIGNKNLILSGDFPFNDIEIHSCYSINEAIYIFNNFLKDPNRHKVKKYYGNKILLFFIITFIFYLLIKKNDI